MSRSEVEKFKEARKLAERAEKMVAQLAEQLRSLEPPHQRPKIRRVVKRSWRAAYEAYEWGWTQPINGRKTYPKIYEAAQKSDRWLNKLPPTAASFAQYVRAFVRNKSGLPSHRSRS